MNFWELGAYIIHTVGAPLFVMCFSVLFIFVLLHIEIPFMCLKVYCPYKKKILKKSKLGTQSLYTLPAFFFSPMLSASSCSLAPCVRLV